MMHTKIALLGSADVFVAPTSPGRASASCSLEAMASGVPIVASELPSFVDVLGAPQEEGRLGELFAAGDHHALAAAVLRVLEPARSAPSLAAQQAARGYDWSSVGSNVLAVYRAALSAAPVPSAAKDVG